MDLKDRIDMVSAMIAMNQAITTITRALPEEKLPARAELLELSKEVQSRLRSLVERLEHDAASQGARHG